VPSDHPRLGGWADLASDSDRLARLPGLSPWAATNLNALIALEEAGLAATQGRSLVHFDAYPHNILLTDETVLLADWPHARLGAPFLDLVMFATSAAADDVDPEPIVTDHAPAAGTEPHVIDEVLGAHAGFCVAGGLNQVSPLFAPIIAAKAELGQASTAWLQRRLTQREATARSSRWQRHPGAEALAGAARIGW
jgi:thiamine kinase-like enzyme